MKMQGKSTRVVVGLVLLEIVSLIAIAMLVYSRQGELTPAAFMTTLWELPPLLDAIVIGAYRDMGLPAWWATILGHATRIAVDLGVLVLFVVYVRRAVRERRAARKSS